MKNFYDFCEDFREAYFRCLIGDVDVVIVDGICLIGKEEVFHDYYSHIEVQMDHGELWSVRDEMNLMFADFTNENEFCEQMFQLYSEESKNDQKRLCEIENWF